MPRDGQHRHRHVSGRCPGCDGVAEERRHGDVSRQGGGEERLPVLLDRPSAPSSEKRLQFETGLREAVGRDEISLHYQAKVDISSGEIRGVEALMRWSHPEFGEVSPAQFIPIAEESGLIVPLGLWALRAACEQTVAWIRSGLPQLSMAVNLSPRQFLDPNLVDSVRQVLEETGMPPNLLELEITEGVMLHDIEAAIKKLMAIRNLGVRLAVDDFGTGYSSLSQLKRFPIDALKIDRSFIRGIPTDKDDIAITEAILALGRTLGVTIVAEGVETSEQQAFLERHACHEMQGFYFSRPIPPSSLRSSTAPTPAGDSCRRRPEPAHCRRQRDPKTERNREGRETPEKRPKIAKTTGLIWFSSWTCRLWLPPSRSSWFRPSDHVVNSMSGVRYDR